MVLSLQVRKMFCLVVSGSVSSSNLHRGMARPMVEFGAIRAVAMAAVLAVHLLHCVPLQCSGTNSTKPKYPTGQ